MPALRMPAALRGVTGQAIANAAESYIGRWTYVFGGIPNPPKVLAGDCSSFVSTVLGYNLGLALPGGKWGAPGFPPGAHGPVVEDYAAWTGATTVGTPQAGDLCCFVGAGANGHIGIALDSDRMVSALNPQQGCVETPIVGYGPPGAPLIYRRIAGLPAGAAAFLNAAGQSTGTPNPAALVIVLLAPFLVVGAIGLAASALAAGAAWAISKAMA
jgi:hypothetical protein